jgi:hypothetical protein
MIQSREAATEFFFNTDPRLDFLEGIKIDVPESLYELSRCSAARIMRDGLPKARGLALGLMLSAAPQLFALTP